MPWVVVLIVLISWGTRVQILRRCSSKPCITSGNQGGGYHSNYPRQGGPQGWARNEGLKDRDHEWRDDNPIWKDAEKDRYVPSHEHQKTKNLEGGKYEDMLSRILKKVEVSNKNLKGMKKFCLP